MRKATTILLLAGSSALLGACGSGGIMSRERPDEFAVQRQAPLVVPPDFRLEPPAPGAPRPTEGTAAEQALDALFGDQAPKFSQAEAAALQRAGEADSGIRSSVGDAGTFTVDKGSTTQAIVAAPEGDGQDARAVIPG
ncbi:conserved hypothetical protein [Altererythrobacter sp. B11]|uniref:DUF3035 domain-containing protein n=1 Tax=Altererythrobacter sp. B11 TaxID=2060312 RepID=UPI000DC70690|nr:DUF3035 domain-containing protein [Altererythrobacter sp. B11]BBC71376.1 conserved hypothetical protein [Altererythrobacter sp. B11]